MTATEVLARLASSRTASIRIEGEVRGTGTGTVEVVLEGATVVLVDVGTWTLGGHSVRWRSSSRWRVCGNALEVERVRQGESARVVLEVGPDGVWRSVEAWICGFDAYSVGVTVLEDAVEVVWTIRGAAKASRTVTRYG
ncbi:DUF6314 family protein [Rubrivirga sp.]|uniref:DUF6314 family protein n=1 Tax=Rubrivirga sp. TaxID=1885344 RepID=UPI003C77E9AF